MYRSDGDRTPGFKLVLAIVVGFVLTIPLFSVWLLVYDRQTQSREATPRSPPAGAAPQAMAGPVLVIPYRATATETVVENGQSVTRSRDVTRELTLAPEAVELSTDVRPQVRKRSIYEAVVYDAQVSGQGALRLPAGPRPDRRRSGADGPDPRRAALRPQRSARARRQSAGPADGRPLRLQPGGGSSGGRGFFAWVDATGLPAQADRRRLRLRLPRQ